jgi:hypothetical protein
MVRLIKTCKEGTITRTWGITLKGDSTRLSTCNESMVNPKANDTLTDEIEIKVKMTRWKKGKANTIE